MMHLRNNLTQDEKKRACATIIGVIRDSSVKTSWSCWNDDQLTQRILSLLVNHTSVDILNWMTSSQPALFNSTKPVICSGSMKIELGTSD